MSDKTGIEWTRGDDGTAGATWNPVTGCEEVSEGCDRCYAKAFAERWRGTPGHHFERGFDVTLRPERLDQPSRWKRPRRIFVNSMSDLFHEDVPDGFIACVFAVMAVCPQHTFQVLTKRHARMRSLLNSDGFQVQCFAAGAARGWDMEGTPWPLPNVHLGVSVESQKWADIRVPALLDAPAAVRWLSCEPLLGPLDLFARDHSGHERDDAGEFPGGWTCLDCSGPGGIGWVVAGGESGPGARRCEVEWLRSLAAQCADAGVPYFVKQLGSVLGRELGAGPKGGSWDKWPDDLRIRQFPRVPAPGATPPGTPRAGGPPARGPGPAVPAAPVAGTAGGAPVERPPGRRAPGDPAPGASRPVPPAPRGDGHGPGAAGRGANADRGPSRRRRRARPVAGGGRRAREGPAARQAPGGGARVPARHGPLAAAGGRGVSTPGTGLGDRCLAALELLGGEGTSAQVAELAGRRGRVPSQGQVAAVLRALASRAGAPVERAGGREGKAARWRLTGAGGGGA